MYIPALEDDLIDASPHASLEVSCVSSNIWKLGSNSDKVLAKSILT